LNGNIAPAPETLSEIKLQTSLYDASTGRSAGGNFQLVAKSGTNQFNGSAYSYLQNENFNANVSSSTIVDLGLGDEQAAQYRELHVYSYRLRAKLADFGLQIETMVNVGYRLLIQNRAR